MTNNNDRYYPNCNRDCEWCDNKKGCSRRKRNKKILGFLLGSCILVFAFLQVVPTVLPVVSDWSTNTRLDSATEALHGMEQINAYAMNPLTGEFLPTEPILDVRSQDGLLLASFRIPIDIPEGTDPLLASMIENGDEFEVRLLVENFLMNDGESADERDARATLRYFQFYDPSRTLPAPKVLRNRWITELGAPIGHPDHVLRLPLTLALVPIGIYDSEVTDRQLVFVSDGDIFIATTHMTA